MIRTFSIIKHSYVKAQNQGLSRMNSHLRYIAYRPGPEKERNDSRNFFSVDRDAVPISEVKDALKNSEGKDVVSAHKLIMSPGTNAACTEEYVRMVMDDLARHKGLDLVWYAVRHDNTEHAHAHVVVMPIDKHGKRVRFDRNDHHQMRVSGDQYLWRSKLIDKDKVLDKEPEKSPGFIEKLKQGMLDLAKRIRKEFLLEENNREPQLLDSGPNREDKSFGAKIDYRLITERNAEKVRQKKEREYKRYSRPIYIDIFSNSSTSRTVQYTPRSSLQRLRKLERLYKSQDNRIREQMSEQDAERVTGWIKDTYREEKRLEAKASVIKEITVELSAEDKISLTAQSSQKELSRMKQLHSARTIHLKDEEVKALNLWIKQQLRQKSFPERTRSEPDK